MDSLSALGVFVRAAEARSFTDAGRRLSVSSSAVGKTISRLEDRLGVRLFHRNTRAITLTPEGELFLESCRRIFSEINKIELEFSQSKSTPKGRLKVSLPDVGMLMMPTLHGFMREYPEIQVDAEFTDNVVDVIDGGTRPFDRKRTFDSGNPNGRPRTPQDECGHGQGSGPAMASLSVRACPG